MPNIITIGCDPAYAKAPAFSVYENERLTEYCKIPIIGKYKGYFPYYSVEDIDDFLYRHQQTKFETIFAIEDTYYRNNANTFKRLSMLVEILCYLGDINGFDIQIIPNSTWTSEVLRLPTSAKRGQCKTASLLLAKPVIVEAGLSPICDEDITDAIHIGGFAARRVLFQNKIENK